MASSATIFDNVHQVLFFDIGAKLASFFSPAPPKEVAPMVSAPQENLDEHEFRCRTDAWSDLSMYLPNSF